MKLLFLISFFLILSISCNKIDKGVIFLKDIKKDTIIKIPLKSFGSPTTAILKVKGFVEDTCSLMKTGLILPKGKVDTNFKYDYYNSEEYFLQYYSKKSKKSNLKIEYYIP